MWEGVVCLKGAEVSYLSKSLTFSSNVNYKTLSLNVWKVKQLDVHFSHILKAVRFPKTASKLK